MHNKQQEIDEWGVRMGNLCEHERQANWVFLLRKCQRKGMQLPSLTYTMRHTAWTLFNHDTCRHFRYQNPDCPRCLFSKPLKMAEPHQWMNDEGMVNQTSRLAVEIFSLEKILLLSV